MHYVYQAALVQALKIQFIREPNEFKKKSFHPINHASLTNLDKKLVNN